jgi:hypothetical protein
VTVESVDRVEEAVVQSTDPVAEAQTVFLGQRVSGTRSLTVGTGVANAANAVAGEVTVGNANKLVAGGLVGGAVLSLWVAQQSE